MEQKCLIQRLENIECQLHTLTERQCFIQVEQECMLSFMNDLAGSLRRFMKNLADSQQVSHTPVSLHGSQHGSTATPVARPPHSARMLQRNYLPRPQLAPTCRPAARHPPHHDESVASGFVAAVTLPQEQQNNATVSTTPHVQSHEGRSARSPAPYARLGDGGTKPEQARMCSIYDP